MINILDYNNKLVLQQNLEGTQLVHLDYRDYPIKYVLEDTFVTFEPTKKTFLIEQTKEMYEFAMQYWQSIPKIPLVRFYLWEANLELNLPKSSLPTLEDFQHFSELQQYHFLRGLNNTRNKHQRGKISNKSNVEIVLCPSWEMALLYKKFLCSENITNTNTNEEV